jgi:hypothetical protein
MRGNTVSKMPRKDHADIATKGRVSEGAACVKLGVSRTTMRRWRTQGRGPAYIVEHKRLISYALDDLEAFVPGGKPAQVAPSLSAAA